MMEASKQNHPRFFLSTIFHILHVCISIGLVIAVIRNQLVNESRFERLEQNDCKCPSKNEDKSLTKDKTDITTAHPLAKRTLDDRLNLPSQNKHVSYNDTEIPGLGSMNKSLANSTVTEEATASTTVSTRFKILKSSVEKSKQNSSSKLLANSIIPKEAEASASTTVSTQLKILSGIVDESEQNSPKKFLANNTILKEAEATSNTTVSTDKTPNSSVEAIDARQLDQNSSTSTEYKTISEILGKEARQLFTCFEKLKVILESRQITTGNREEKNREGCRLFQGLKGDPGEKGEPGQKGAMGPKGCSGTSLAYPTFQSSSRYLVFDEGDPAVLSCNATANPSAQITWYRDNVMLTGKRDNSSHRYFINNRKVVTNPASSRPQMCPSEIPHPVAQSTLVIKQLRGSDTGTYFCKARNILGVYSYKIRILVQVYVQFTETPANLTLVQGNDAQLRCRASGVPTPVITWYRKDSGSMPSRYNITGGDLHIHKIRKEDEGLFVCLATNVLGSKTTEATITVNVFPKITSFLDQPITINESQTLVLPCNATGYPNPEIRWSKVNHSLPEGRYVHDSQMLNISRVNYEDRGEYICTANNTVGSSVKKMKVIVQVGPKIVIIPNATEFGYRGRTKRLSFQVFSFPKANIGWKRPYWDRRSDARFRQENGDLIIEDVKYTDSGRYQATARNILGEVKVTTFLIVRDAVFPFLTTKPPKEVMTFSTGQTISLTCTAAGVPNPKVTWRNPTGNVLTSGVTGPDSSRTVRIGYFTSQKRGRYQCTAQNEFGVDEAHVYLLINSDIRLADASLNSYKGRVEVYKGGTWGTVCNHQWDMKHARIACRQLGFRNATSAFTKSRVGHATGTVYRFICRGNEKRLQDCNTGPTYSYRYRYSSYYNNNNRRYKSYICTKNVDAYINCN